MSRIDDAIIRSRAYGEGVLRVTNPALAKPVGNNRSGICQYHLTQAPLLFDVLREYSVCWTCICKLKKTYGDEWEQRAKFTLQRNREFKLQAIAQREAEKRRGTMVGIL